MRNSDKAFVNDYEFNIESILSKKNEISGTKRIDTNSSEDWINSQKTQLKKDVAKFFIENTIYVSFNEYFDSIGNLVLTNYERIVDGARQIIVCSGLRTKSQYMTTVIALYFIKKFGFREPDTYVTSISFENTQDPILIFDDMSYSGSQMGSMFEMMFNKKFKYGDKPTFEITEQVLPKINLLLYGVNKNSLKRLNTIECIVKVIKEVVANNEKFEIKVQTLVDFVSPFKVHYEIMFKIFREINNDMSNLVNFFFSPYLLGNPYLSIYFDHKIADDVSTYMKVLQFGPIIPNSYSINSYKKHIEDYLSVYVDARTDIADVLESGLSQDEIKDIMPNLVKNYGYRDKIDETDVKILFKPFITGCRYSSEFYRTLENTSYNEFLFPEPSDMSFQDTHKRYITLWNYIHSDKILCLTPFYKTDWNKNKQFRSGGRKTSKIKTFKCKTMKANRTMRKVRIKRSKNQED